jgi:N-acetylneuraminic acid mutarotase
MANVVAAVTASASAPPNTWFAQKSLPSARSGVSAVLDGSLEYVLGGLDTSGTPAATVYARNLANGKWRTLPPMPIARWVFAAAVGGDGRVYAIGGDNSNGPTAEVDAYSPTSNSWTTVAPLPTTNYGMTAATGSDGRIYVMGGLDLVNGGALAAVEVYDPTTNAWASVAPMSTQRYGGAAALGLDGRIYVMGGNTTGYHGDGVSSAEAYSPASNTWTTLPSMSAARSYLSAATGADGRVYALGGLDPNGTYLSSVEAYNIQLGAWQPIAPLPTPLGDSAAVSAGGTVSVFGGVTPTADGLATVRGYTPGPPAVNFTHPGLQTGGIAVPITLYGSGFTPQTTVAISGTGVNVRNEIYVSTSQITLSLDATSGTPGNFDVTVSNPNDGSSTCDGCVALVQGPSVNGIIPMSVSPGNSYAVTVTGSLFSPGIALRLEHNVSFSSISVSPDGTTITATMTVKKSAATGSDLTLSVINPAAVGGGRGYCACVTVG